MRVTVPGRFLGMGFYNEEVAGYALILKTSVCKGNSYSAVKNANSWAPTLTYFDMVYLERVPRMCILNEFFR